MKIDEITIGEARELMKMFDGCTSSARAGQCKTSPFDDKLNKNILVRTVTMILTGRLVEIWPQELVLEDAAWIADTGRYHKAFQDPSVLDEVEPYPDGRIVVGRGALIDCALWPHDLPRTAK